jgi:hypothetical protein
LALSANTTVIPDAAPGNAASIDVSSSTSFKGTLEADPATGVVRVTDAHPAGNHVVTVKAFDSTGASAERTFALTVTTPPTCSPFYFAVTHFAAGTGPGAIAVGDFNRDGKQDLAAANGTSSTVSILLGNGAGGFSSHVDFPIGYASSSIAIGDFNADGKQDLVSASFYAGTVSVLLGDGAGNFSAPTDFNAGHYVVTVVVGDFNRDGKEDLAVTNNDTGNVSILTGDGTGQFSGPKNFAAGYALNGLAVGDFDGDGKQDLAATRDLSDKVSILLGDGAGGFGAVTEFTTGDYPRAVVVGDFNADNKQDLAIEYYSGSGVSILLGTGAGSFGAPTNYSLGYGGGDGVAVADLNGDGKQDVVVTGGGSSSAVSALLGDGAGAFSAATVFFAGERPTAIAAGDFNGDGMQDLATANRDSNDVSIMLRACAPTATTVVSRKAHDAGFRNFNVPLPLNGSVGVECRHPGASGDHRIWVYFSSKVSVNGSPQAEVLSGTAAIGSNGVPNGGAVTAGGNLVIIPLTGVADAQMLRIRLNDVDGSTDLTIPMGVLLGDTSGDGFVNSGDSWQSRSRSRQQLDATNCRYDVNLDGSLNSGDATIVRSRAGMAFH